MAWVTPRTWNDELASSAKFTQELKTNLLVLKDPPSANYEANEGANYSVTGTSWADFDTDFNLSITTTGGDVLLGFTGVINATGDLPSIAYIDVSVDGTRIINQSSAGLIYVTTSTFLTNFTRLVTGLSAGSHTFKLQAKCSSAIVVATIYAGAGTANYDVHPQFWARELT